MFLEILPNSQKNIFVGISFLIKLQAAEAATGGRFSCEFCEISKNTFFAEYVWAAAFKAGILKLSEAATGDFQ